MYEELKNSQIKEMIDRLKGHLSTPRSGWIRLIRESYGMTTRVLAARLGVSQTSIVQYEKNEVGKRVTLNVLVKVADALNCDFYYAFVPRQPVDDYLEAAASKKAKEITDEIVKTMELESQSVKQSEVKVIYQSILEEFRKNPKDIWND